MPIKRVLVVDDAEPDRTNLTQILSDAGIRVFAASNGREALEIARKDTPDLIFLDVLMPEMDGFEACRTLHADVVTKDIPVVMVSSKSNRADRVWAMEQGAVGYVTKPYTVDDIQGVMSRFG